MLLTKLKYFARSLGAGYFFKLIPSKKRAYIKYTLEKQNNILSSFKKPLVVLNGPFKGMKYLDESFCSTLLPKLNGTYEKEISDWFVFNGEDYSAIFDIGSAEGYYAVGLAKRFPKKKVRAYDTDPKARNLCKRLSILNEVTNLEIKGECTFKEIDSFPKKSLIICDIEGYEKCLLNPSKASFIDKTIIVEAHEVFEKKIVAILIERFKNTHNFEIRYNLLEKRSVQEEELRGGFTPWIRMTPKRCK